MPTTPAGAAATTLGRRLGGRDTSGPKATLGGQLVQRDYSHPETARDAGAGRLHCDHRCHGLPEADCADDPRPGADNVLSLQSNQLQLHEAVAETFAVEQAEGFES